MWKGELQVLREELLDVGTSDKVCGGEFDDFENLQRFSISIAIYR